MNFKWSPSRRGNHGADARAQVLYYQHVHVVIPRDCPCWQCLMLLAAMCLWRWLLGFGRSLGYWRCYCMSQFEDKTGSTLCATHCWRVLYKHTGLGQAFQNCSVCIVHKCCFMDAWVTIFFALQLRMKVSWHVFSSAFQDIKVTCPCLPSRSVFTGPIVVMLVLFFSLSLLQLLLIMNIGCNKALLLSMLVHYNGV